MKYKSSYYEGTKFEKITHGDVPDMVWHLSMARGCIDYDRCNEHTLPHGSCTECLTDAQRIIDELRAQGISLEYKDTASN